MSWELILAIVGLILSVLGLAPLAHRAWERRPDWCRRRHSDRQLAEFIAPGKPPIYFETFPQESDGRPIVRGVGGRAGEEPASLLRRTQRTLGSPYEGYRFSRLCPDFGQPMVALPEPGVIYGAQWR